MPLAAIAMVGFGLHVLGFRIQLDVRPKGIEVHRAPAETTELPMRAKSASRPRNIILFVADGMGFAHLSAARAVHHGIDGPAVWDRFSTSGWMRAHPSSGYLIDSAASATALSLGVPTNRGAVGVEAGGSALPTLFERAATRGYRTGAVTDSYFWDATPAAFAAHAANRADAATLIGQLAMAPLDVLFGELKKPGKKEIPNRDETERLLSQRYTVFGPEPSNFEERLRAAPPDQPVAALFEEAQITDLRSEPNLKILTSVALERLQATSAPFVLLIESEETDSASHDQDFPRLLRGLQSIEATLELLLDFAELRTDTLLIFTSDHETGGLALGASKDNASLQAIWGSDGHTGVMVPLMATGPGAQDFGGSQANWQVGKRLAQLLETEVPPRGGSGRESTLAIEKDE